MPHGSQASVPAESYTVWPVNVCPGETPVGTDRIAALTLTHWQVLVPLLLCADDLI